MFKDHFSHSAASYAAYRPTYPSELVSFLADTARRNEFAWDCGCGSGQLSTLLAERFQRVYATDASAKQIENAVSHPQVQYACAPAESSGLGDSVADLIVAAQAAHWFDLPVFYREVRRVGRPGCRHCLGELRHFEGRRTVGSRYRAILLGRDRCLLAA